MWAYDSEREYESRYDSISSMSRLVLYSACGAQATVAVEVDSSRACVKDVSVELATPAVLSLILFEGGNATGTLPPRWRNLMLVESMVMNDCGVVATRQFTVSIC